MLKTQTTIFLAAILSCSISLAQNTSGSAKSKSGPSSTEKQPQKQPEKQTEQPSEEQKEEDQSVLRKTGDEVKKVGKKVQTEMSEARQRREQASFVGLFNYSPIDLLIPSKIGATIGYVSNADRTWELEYLRGSIKVPFVVEDLGEMSDTRISLIGRSYFGSNSFNFSYGVSYFDFSLHLGSDLINRVTAGAYPSIDVVAIQAFGFNLGLGNRWVFDHGITFGVDWFAWSQPVVITKKEHAFLTYANNQSDKDKVDNAVKFVSYFPRLTFLKLQLGMQF